MTINCEILHKKQLHKSKFSIILVYKCTTTMSEFEKRSLELEVRRFASRNFTKPSECRNLDQVRYYIQELCTRIEDYKRRFNYVPMAAYALLSQYNSKQNTLLYHDFLQRY